MLLWVLTDYSLALHFNNYTGRPPICQLWFNIQAWYNCCFYGQLKTFCIYQTFNVCFRKEYMLYGWVDLLFLSVVLLLCSHTFLHQSLTALFLYLPSPQLVGSMDPYQRAPRSPRGKKAQQPQPLNGSNPALNEEGARSPTSDQVSTWHEEIMIQGSELTNRREWMWKGSICFSIQ